MSGKSVNVVEINVKYWWVNFYYSTIIFLYASFLCHFILLFNVHLLTHKFLCSDAINTEKLKELPGDSLVFEAIDSSDREGLKAILDKACPAKRTLELKVGAQVMLLKNVNVARGRANGTRGVIVRFASGLPLVRVRIIEKKETGVLL